MNINMGKYIDAEKLKKFVGELKKEAQRNCCDTWGIVPNALEEVEGFIETLQQEQNSIQDTELTVFESALFTAFSYAWQSYLGGEEVNVIQWVKENSVELLEAARFQQEQQEVVYIFKPNMTVDEMKNSINGKQPEVELEREIVENLGDDVWNDTSIRIQQVLIKIAHHFYKLGLNARKEE